MSSSDLSRRAFALAGLTALAGCGFTPVYGPGGSASALAGALSVTVPATAEGTALGLRIEQRLGPATSGRYLLNVELTLSERDIATAADQTITRFNVDGAARWTLTDRTADSVVASGTERSFTGYSATGTTVATQAARRDARDRLAVILADLILARIIQSGAVAP